jgi:hypothetical protein
VAANAIHAVVAAETGVPALLAAAVAAVPPLVLLAITHLTVILTRATHARSTYEPGAVGDAGRSVASVLSLAGTVSEPAVLAASTAVMPSRALPARTTPSVEVAVVDVPGDAVPARVGKGQWPGPPLTAPRSPAAPRADAGLRERAVQLRGLGWSNGRIAEDLGVHRATVGRWLTATPAPPGTPAPPAVPASPVTASASVPSRVGVPAPGSGGGSGGGKRTANSVRTGAPVDTTTYGDDARRRPTPGRDSI